MFARNCLMLPGQSQLACQMLLWYKPQQAVHSLLIYALLGWERRHHPSCTYWLERMARRGSSHKYYHMTGLNSVALKNIFWAGLNPFAAYWLNPQFLVDT